MSKCWWAPGKCQNSPSMSARCGRFNFHGGSIFTDKYQIKISVSPQGISKLRLESSKGHASFIKNTAVHIPNQLSYLKRRKSSWKLFIDGTGQPLDNLDISFTFSILNYVFLNIYHLFLWISFFQNSTISYKSYSQYSLYDVLIILKSKSFGMENYW